MRMKRPAPDMPRTATAAVVAAGVMLAASCAANPAVPGALVTVAPPVTATMPGAAAAAAAAGAPATAAPPATARMPGRPGAAPNKPHGPGIAPGGQATGTLANGTTWVANFPKAWNGTLVLYSHGFGALTAADAPDGPTQSAMLGAGYALAGSSYDPGGSQWALNTAVSDQFGALAAVEAKVLPRQPAHVLAFGTSMGGLISALEAQDGQGKIDGALTTCGIVAGGVNLVDYQLDGEYAIAQLLGSPSTQLVGLNGNTANTTATALNDAAQQAQQTPAGQARLALAMAFLNIPAWDPNSSQPAAANAPGAQEQAQYDTLMDSADNVLDFIESGRVAIEQASGQAAATAGTNFAQAFAASPFAPEVAALYQTAGLNLQTDLAALTAKATIKASPAARQSLAATSDPTGRLAVPELDLHTIGDNLAPVANENYYAQQVTAAGDSGLLRQAYTNSYGHCNFSVSEQVAALQAVLQRVTSGQWGSVATAASLEQAATALHIGPANFMNYSPGKLTGAVTAS
jgi:hypothetical protein